MPKRKSKKKSARKKAKPLVRSSLVARSSHLSTVADIDITFTAGLGQATASLFRKGILINMQSISMSDIIHFSEVQPGDVIVINGVCTGNVIIRINVSTTPPTPTNFTVGTFNIIYGVLGL